MNLPITSASVTLPPEMSDDTRVWIYQADRQLSESEAEEVGHLIRSFSESWSAHNVKLKAAGRLYFNRFVCLFADESKAGASGCSIDSSVRFVQGLEKSFRISLTNRMQMAYLDSEGVHAVPLQELPHLINLGHLEADTIVFNNLVANIGDMKSGWMVPLRDSWHMRFARP